MGLVQHIIKREKTPGENFTPRLVDFKENKKDVVVLCWVNRQAIHLFLSKLYCDRGGKGDTFIEHSLRIMPEDAAELKKRVEDNKESYLNISDWNYDIGICNEIIRLIEEEFMVYYRARGD